MNILIKSTAVGLVIITISCQNNGTSDNQQSNIKPGSSDVTNKDNLINKQEDIIKQDSNNNVIVTTDNSKSVTNKKDDTSSFSHRLFDKLMQQKSIVNTSVIDTNNASSITDTISVLNQRKVETFTISTAKDTVIIGTKGVMVYIPDNAFDTKDSEKVVIKMEEYVDLSDMLLAKMTTTSNGQLLETGGMINIKATANDKELALKPGKSIVVHLPKKKYGIKTVAHQQKKEKEFGLFYGVNKGSGINWVQDKIQATLMYDESIMLASEKRWLFLRYTNNTMDLIQQFNAKFSRDTSMLPFIKKHLIDITYCIDLSGHCVVKKIDYNFKRRDNKKFILDVFDAKIKDFFYNLPLLNPPSKQNKEYMACITYGWVPRFTNNADYNAAFEKKYFAGKTYDETELDNYILSVSKMGMINCDRYPDVNSEKVHFAVNTTTSYKSELMLILKDFKSISSSYRKSYESYVFDNIPKDLNVKILIIQYRPNQTYYALKDSNTSKLKESNFDFKPMTASALKKELESLN